VTPKPLLQLLNGQKASKPPVWLMRQAGRYLPEYLQTRQKAGDFLTLCYTPDLAAEVTLQPIRRFGFDAAILFSDILVVPHGLGQNVWFETGEGPRLDPLTGAADLAQLSVERMREKLAPVYQAIGYIAAALPPQTTFIGFAGAPWTVATYMVEGRGSKDHLQTRVVAATQPEFFARLIDLLVAATIAHLSAQIDHGAQVVQLFDSWAGVLDEQAFAQWVIAPTRRIVDALRRAYPQVPIIGFPRGAGVMAPLYAAETGVTALGLDTAVPTGWAHAHLPADLPLQGNLDPALLVAGGALLRQRVGAICAAFAERPHIFNLGHGIVPQTPLEHVALLCALLRGEA
jgi:uroporphyrinogen decarboxylase